MAGRAVLALLVLALCTGPGQANEEDDDVVASMLSKIPLLRPLVSLGARDPRAVFRFMSTRMGQEAARITDGWLLETRQMARGDSAQQAARVPALNLPVDIEERVAKNQQEWLKVMGDSDLPENWRKAIFSPDSSAGALVQHSTAAATNAGTSSGEVEFQTPPHNVLEGVRRSVGVYSLASRLLSLILSVYLAVVVFKMVMFRPAGTSERDWAETGILQRQVEKVRGVMPSFFAGFLFLLAAKSQLDHAPEYVQTFFTDPNAEKKEDSVFPLGDGKFFIE